MVSSSSMVVVTLCLLTTDFLKKTSTAPSGASSENEEIYFSLNGSKYTNGSSVLIKDIGTEDKALICVTSNPDCCYSRGHAKAGDFYYPDGSVVGFSVTAGVYRSRGDRVVRLNVRNSDQVTPGTYRCEIPDSSGNNQNISIHLVLPCPSLTPPTNGVISYSPPGAPTGLNTVATYSCINGYTLMGSDTRTCQSDGSWTGDNPTCQPIDCGSPPSITNGSPRTPTRTTFGGTVNYICDSGYILSGPTMITCQATGNWSSRPSCPLLLPTRLAIGAIEYPPNSKISITDIGRGGEYPALACFIEATSTAQWYFPDGSVVPLRSSYPPNNTIISFRQPTAITLHRGDGATSPTGLYCCGSPTLPVDQRLCVTLSITCPALVDIANGMIVYSAGTYVFGTTATYHCIDGYFLIGANKVRTCVDDGSRSAGVWSGQPPMCLSIAATVISSDDLPSFGRVYSLTCIVTGADLLNSTISYQWFKTTPRRKPVETDSPTLTFNPLALSDAGQYSCEVNISSTLLLDGMISLSGYYQLKFLTLNFQLRLNGISDCRQYITLEANQKAQDITNSIARGINNICGCGFNTGLLSSTFLKCDEKSPQHVTYRAVLFESDTTTTLELVSYMDEWAKATQSLVVQSVQLRFNTTCLFVIIDFNSPECPQVEIVDNQMMTTTPSISMPTYMFTEIPGDSNVSQAVIGGAFAGVLFVILLATAVVILVVVVMRRKVRSLNMQISGAKVQSQSVPLSKVTQSPQAQPYETASVETPAYEAVATDHKYEDVKFRKHTEQIEQPQTKPQEEEYSYIECPAYRPTNAKREAPVVSSEEERAA